MRTKSNKIEDTVIHLKRRGLYTLLGFKQTPLHFKLFYIHFTKSSEKKLNSKNIFENKKKIKIQVVVEGM